MNMPGSEESEMPSVDPTQPEALPPQFAGAPHHRAGALINEKYLLEARLGRGGMGTVWLAQNVLLESPVAIKMIDPSMQRADLVERFLLEARVEARFNHPNIVRVFDFGHTQLGEPFIVMEVLDGITLGDFVRRRGRLDPIEAVQLVLPIVDALCHVHARGVVHRDLKPDNILLDQQDADTTPKLLDFGVAKLLDGSPGPCANEVNALIGSPGYMSPEQVQGSEHVDHRADIWAICVVLYEAVSGKTAFPGEGMTPLRAVLEAPPPTLDDTASGEPELAAILARGMEKDLALRFQSMSELGAALAQWLYDRGEREDLNGGRLSRTWQVVTASGAPERPAARQRREVEEISLASLADSRREPSDLTAVDTVACLRNRREWIPRAAVAAAIVLASIAVPSNLRFDGAISTAHVTDVAQRVLARLAQASNEVQAMLTE
jgi:serine/threonine-protein kinase